MTSIDLTGYTLKFDGNGVVTQCIPPAARPTYTPTSQRGAPWGSMLLGNSKTSTIGMYGCLLTCFAMLAGANPLVMNAAVRDAGGFDPEPRGAYMRTFDIAGPAYAVGGRRVKLAQVSDKYANVPTPKATLDQLGYHLYNGHPCIIEVDLDPKSPAQQQHFVLATPTGTDGKPSPTILDPWDGVAKSLVPAFGADMAAAVWRFIAYEVTL